jgi:hypothetical protein
MATISADISVTDAAEYNVKKAVPVILLLFFMFDYR